MAAAAVGADQPPSSVAPDGSVIVELSLINLPAGAYALAVSHVQFGTPVEILLPRAALPEGAPSLEDRLATGFVPGDLDGDGILSATDINLGESFISGAQVPTADQVTHGDTNGNGQFDAEDLQRLRDHLAGTRDLYAEWPTAIYREPLNRTVVEFDADGDGIPDSWEWSHGSNPHDSGDAALDNDNDGLSNLAEYLTGTDPFDAQSHLRIDSVSVTSNRFDLRFKAIGEKSYSVQYRTSLDSGTWQPLTDVEADFYTRNVIVTDGLGAGRGQRFYRLVTPAQP